MRSLAASLTPKWKQTPTLTSRLRTPPETADAIAGSERRCSRISARNGSANSSSFCRPTETEVDVGRIEYQRDTDSDYLPADSKFLDHGSLVRSTRAARCV